MEGANGATNWTIGCAENLILQVGDMLIKTHAHVVEHASFDILLGRPFQQAAGFRFEDLPSGKVEVSVRDPADPARRIYLATCPHAGRASAVKMVSVQNTTVSHMPLSAAPTTAPHALPPLPPADPSILVLKYKRVDQKV